MNDTEPTEAGLRLLEKWFPGGGDGLDGNDVEAMRQDIRKIEAEARAEQAAQLAVVVTTGQAWIEALADDARHAHWCDAQHGDKCDCHFGPFIDALANSTRPSAAADWLAKNNAEVARAAVEADTARVAADIQTEVAKRVAEISGNAKRAAFQRVRNHALWISSGAAEKRPSNEFWRGREDAGDDMLRFIAKESALLSSTPDSTEAPNHE